jgi:hypothetical protein
MLHLSAFAGKSGIVTKLLLWSDRRMWPAPLTFDGRATFGRKVSA